MGLKRIFFGYICHKSEQSPKEPRSNCVLRDKSLPRYLVCSFY